MSKFLVLALLFCIGSFFGWVLELFYRNINRENKEENGWINPGFCTGPYLPIYGCGLCVLYLISSAEFLRFFNNTVIDKIIIFILMAVSMTVIEYIAGIAILKFYNVRLWDYNDEWGNIKGIICPKYSLFWAILGAVYYFAVHRYILKGLAWFSQNLVATFLMGMFFGVFIIDIIYSLRLVEKLKKFARENQLIVQYESIKSDIRNYYKKNEKKYNFFRPFRTDRNLNDHLLGMKKSFEQWKKR